MITEAEIEQNVANELFKRHGILLGPNGRIGEFNIGLEVTEEFSNSSNWRYARKNGKIRVNVGGWMCSRATGFRMKNDGTFNYDKIADKMVEKYDEIVARKKREATNKIANEDYDAMIDRATEKHGVSKYGSTLKKNHSRDYQTTYGLQITLNVKSDEQIDALLTLATELGISIH